MGRAPSAARRSLSSLSPKKKRFRRPPIVFGSGGGLNSSSGEGSAKKEPASGARTELLGPGGDRPSAAQQVPQRSRHCTSAWGQHRASSHYDIRREMGISLLLATPTRSPPPTSALSLRGKGVVAQSAACKGTAGPCRQSCRRPNQGGVPHRSSTQRKPSTVSHSGNLRCLVLRSSCLKQVDKSRFSQAFVW